MPIIAVAGGSGNLGHAIVDALLARGEAEVVILARPSNPPKDQLHGARVLSADYNDANALAKTLEDNNVDTVISTLSGMGDIGPEMVLIEAAEKSSTTKRIIPSLWGIEYSKEVVSYLPPLQGKLDMLERMESTSLEWTVVINGFFADYWFTPKIPSYMPPFVLAIDVQNNTAAIPGSGDIPVVFTHTFDIAKFVAALVNLPKWEKRSYISGDKITLNEFVKFLEEAKGVKFNVTYDSVETLKSGKITELPSHPYAYPFFPKEQLQGMSAAFGLMFDSGVFDVTPPADQSLNEKFPDIKPRSIKALAEEAWKV